MSTVFLIPTILYEGCFDALPVYVLETIKQCKVFFVENERTARRFFKSIWKEMVIDDYEWHAIHKNESVVVAPFVSHIKKGNNIGVVSEAGCPGIADPGQILVAKAQELGVKVKPLVGPSSILLSLMASGLNGQAFRFHGYLPIDAAVRKKTLLQLEAEALKTGTVQIFIETPYRNDALMKDILQICASSVKLCVAVDITASHETILTKKIGEWKSKELPVLHKKQVIFLLGI